MDDEDEFIKSSILKEGFGTIGLELYKKLIRAGVLSNYIFTTSGGDDGNDGLIFLKHAVKYFITNFKNEKCRNKLEKFMECLPNLDRLEHICNKCNFSQSKVKELLVMRTILEMYENYLTVNEAPLFKVILYFIITINCLEITREIISNCN